jgi:HlyD family secretion protein
MKQINVRKSLPWVVVVVLVAIGVYRLKFSAVPVSGYPVSKGEVRAEVMGTGTLEARVKTTISPRIQERLAAVLVDQNDTVKAGQLLAQLDDAELKTQVGVAEASLAAAKATAERVRVDESRARAVERQARQEHKRISELLLTKISSQADLDKVDEQLSVAEADLKRTQAAIVEADSQVLTAEKTLAYQKERLGYTRVLSPYDGLVVRRDRDPGGVVVPGGSILQLVSTEEIWVSAWVDETAMSGLSTGQVARVVFRSEPETNFPGEVARLGRETDRETREFLVDVRLKQLPRNWTLGQRAEVFIETGRKAEAVFIPQRFVQWREGKSGVFVLDQGRARWRPISLGLVGRQRVEVAQGVAVGEQVVVVRDLKQPPLVDGKRLSVLTAGKKESGPGQ